MKYTVHVTESKRIAGFVETLHAWYIDHKRDLPWRDLWDLPVDDRAYRVWISEVMLQQTQVSRVIGAYKKFIQEFPDVKALGKASNREILIAWRGMGYNSRALRLRDGANVMVRQAHHDNDHFFPNTFEQLIDINGIGAYTAGAILTFAFDQPTPTIDTNIRRILHRTFIGPENIDGTYPTDDKKLMVIMNNVMTAWLAVGHRGSDLLSALMDYGSLVQTKTNPQWGICALSERKLMKATPKNWKPPVRGAAKEREKKEPGRYVGTTYIPNRIFRGRIVEALRDHTNGLKFDDIGKWISPDHSDEQREWLAGLIKKLEQEGIVRKTRNSYALKD